MTAEKINVDNVGCNDEHMCNSPYADNLKFICKDNPFLANVPILYPLKTPENLWFSSVFRGYKMGTLARNGFKKSIIAYLNINSIRNNFDFLVDKIEKNVDIKMISETKLDNTFPNG